MATINKTGTNGTNGTGNGSGGNGTDAIFTQSGTINGNGNAGFLNGDGGIVNAVGGTGGTGGAGGGSGGNGGNASLTFNGNIFSTTSAATTAVAVQLNATGGNGGTGTLPGVSGNGGNATVLASGNIFQYSKALTSIEFDAKAVGGTGTLPGNATSTISGNIFQVSKATSSVTVNAHAEGTGTNNATLSGNIVQGPVNNVALIADAINSANGTATITGNVVSTSATSTGTVSLEATGNHIAITNNKFTLGLQELDFTLNAASPYDATLTGNTLTGLGSNTFKFTDNDTPGPNTDTVSINLASKTMVFDGQATNAITGFSTLIGAGGATYTFVGDDNANTLTGSTGNDTFTGGKGNDNINGGAGTDTAIYSGTFAQYTVAVGITGNGTVTDNVANRDGTDTLTSIELIKFTDGTYNTATGVFTPNGPANHPPVANPDTYSTNEDTALTVAAGAGVLANDTDPDGNTLTASLVTGPAHGSLTLNSDGSFTYTPAGNYNGADSFTYAANDGHGGITNGVASITVNSVNDAPVGTANTVTTLEDTAYTFAAADFGFTDPNDSPANSLKAVEITTLPAAGTLTDNGVAVMAGQFVAVADITGGLLKFAPAANANGAGYASFTFQVQDNGGTANGGVDTDPTPKTMTVNVTSVNDAPVGTSKTVSTVENTAYTFATGDFGFTDPNDSPANSLKAVEITTLPAHGTLTDNGVAVTAGQFVSATDIAGGLLVFTPGLNATGTGYGTFTFQVQDNGGTANGGVDTDPTPKTMTLNVTAPNHAPVLDAAKTPVLATEGENQGAPSGAVGTLVSSLVSLSGGVSNVTDSDAGAVTGIALTGADTTNGGTWYYSTDGGADWNLVGTVSGTQSLLLAADSQTRVYYQAATNFSGTVTNAVTFRAWDQTSGTAGTKVDTSTNGGTTAFSSATDTANVTVDPVRIGNNYYATINQALAAANNGDTIYVQPGTYNESLLITKQVSIVGVGPAGSVIINGTFAQDNGFAGQSVTDYLKSGGGYTGDTGVTVNADNVNLTNLTVENFKYDVGTQNNAENTPSTDNSVSNLTLTDVNMKDAITGFQKDDGTTLTGLTINGGTISDTAFGVYLSNGTYVAPTIANPYLHDAVNTTIDGTTFTGILEKGIYTETAQGTTNFNNLTMTDVGNYGGFAANGQNGLNGNAIDVNLKYHAYVGNLNIDNDTLSNVGNSSGANAVNPGGQNGAIVIEGRDDPGSSSYDPAFGGHSADTSGLAVTVSGGLIDGTTTGIRAGELKANPANNVTGPAVTVDGTQITNATTADVDNHTNSLMTVIGTNGDDNYVAGQSVASTGPLFMQGNGGNDILIGGLGDDTLQGGTGDDTLDGGPGGSDTADYSDATQNGLVVDLTNGVSSGGGLGNDSLSDIQNLTGSNFNDTLIGDGNDNTLNGGAGNDILYGHGGNNSLIGGAGTDVAYYMGDETGDGYTLIHSPIDPMNPTATTTFISGGPESVGDGISDLDIERLKFLSPTHVSDVDNDGNGDLITQSSAGVISVNGTATTYAPAATTKVVGTGMFNPDASGHNLASDRDADILLQANDGTLSVLTSPTAVAPIGFTGAALNAGNYGTAWKAISAGDFNGDASADVLLWNSTTKTAEIFTVKENSTDAVGLVNNVASVAAPSGTGWAPIAVGDFNGDGKSDILWQNSTTKQVQVYLTDDATGATATTLNTPTSLTATGLTAIGTGDFNGDGNSDILFQNAAGQAVIWYMNGDSHVGTKTITKPAATGTWTVVGAEDIDGNGQSDVLWTDTSGNLRASELSGTTVTVANLGTLPANTHLIASTGGG